jgi:hypothetical protein
MSRIVPKFDEGSCHIIGKAGWICLSAKILPLTKRGMTYRNIGGRRKRAENKLPKIILKKKNYDYFHVYIAYNTEDTNSTA